MRPKGFEPSYSELKVQCQTIRRRTLMVRFRYFCFRFFIRFLLFKYFLHSLSGNRWDRIRTCNVSYVTVLQTACFTILHTHRRHIYNSLRPWSSSPFYINAKSFYHWFRRSGRYWCRTNSSGASIRRFYRVSLPSLMNGIKSILHRLFSISIYYT